MLRHYLLVAFRGLRLHPGYAALNVLGLAAGLAVALVIGLYVRGELAYDRFNLNADRIARVTLVTPDGTIDVTPTIIAPLLKREFPEVEAATRLYDIASYSPPVLRTDAALHREAGFFYADSTVFSVFTMPLVAGDPARALTRPNTLVLSETAAARYFPHTEALGQTVLVGDTPFEVTGVMRDVPAASHVQFSVLGSFASTHWAGEEIWDSANFNTYVLFRDAAALAAFAPKLDARVRQARADGHMGNGTGLALEPLATLHLDVQGQRRYVVLFSAVAALILLIACVNYMNLSTARATRRAREVGVRKATGARRGQLVAQFYGEATLLTGAALGLGLLLVPLLLPLLRAVTGAPLAVRLLDPPLLLGALAVGVVVALLAGSYPAVLLSSFRPAQVLKGQTVGGRGAARFRSALVVFQFAVSVFLLVGTAVVYRQLHYMQAADLGFHGEQTVALPVADGATHERLPALKRALLALPGVEGASAIDRVPGEQRGGYAFQAEGLELAEDGSFPIGGVPADQDVAETLGLQIVAGTPFPKSDGYVPTQGDYRYLLNETAVREAGWTPEDAVGRRVSVSGEYRLGTVVGVFRDYHYLPLQEAVGPLALFVEPEQTGELLVRLAPGSVAGSLAAVEAAWQQVVPDRPFEYRFLDAAFAEAYRTDAQLGRLVAGFSALAILIACLGLFGLSAYAAERRRKEIGVRKVLGASVRDVVLLLSREFAVLVVVGALVAAPIAYVVGRRWLEGFAYHVPLGPGVFLAAGGAVLALALVTVAGQALRAASTDPVESLRSE